jgi:hypothetical protein
MLEVCRKLVQYSAVLPFCTPALAVFSLDRSYLNSLWFVDSAKRAQTAGKTGAEGIILAGHLLRQLLCQVLGARRVTLAHDRPPATDGTLAIQDSRRWLGSLALGWNLGKSLDML